MLLNEFVCSENPTMILLAPMMVSGTNLHPRLIWGRTKTIGRGDDCCDFMLKYKE